MSRSISWILEYTSELPNKAEKIKCLRANQGVLKPILKYAYDPNIEWLLPEGNPPYRANGEALPTDMYKEIRKLYIFVKGGNDNVKPLQREALFVNILEHIPADDAELLLSIKNRKIPFKGITKKLALEAFPDLF